VKPFYITGYSGKEDFSFHRVINDPSIMNAATSAATIATVGFACAVWV
jgi:hypothetical protein